MEYREIVSVTGLGGLYQLLSTKSDGAIVRSLADNATKFISARLHNVTPLESIEIYTTGNNVRLHEVLEAMKGHAAAKPDAKKGGNDEIRAYFKEVYPEMDEDRVYVSDMKKMLKWFELLHTNDLLDFSALQQPQEPAEGEDGTGAAEAAAQVAESDRAEAQDQVALVEDAEKPAKKARAKKAATDESAEGEEKPKKKAAKKKAEGGEENGEEEKPAKKTATRKKKEE